MAFHLVFLRQFITYFCGILVGILVMPASPGSPSAQEPSRHADCRNLLSGRIQFAALFHQMLQIHVSHFAHRIQEKITPTLQNNKSRSPCRTYIQTRERDLFTYSSSISASVRPVMRAIKSKGRFSSFILRACSLFVSSRPFSIPFFIPSSIPTLKV